MKFFSLVVVACMALTSTTEAAPFYANSHGTKAISGNYIVILKGNNTADTFMPKFNLMSSRHSNIRGGRIPKIGRKFSNIPGFTVNGDDSLLKELLADDSIAYVEQDAIYTIQGTQLSPPSYGLSRVSRQTKLPTSGVTSYRFPNSAGAGVTAYVVDTGINTAHVDFGGRAVMGANFIRGSPNTDENGHGTHVAGTVGGRTFGVAKKVSLVGVKVLAKDGSGSTSGIVAALDWIIKVNKNKKAVVNMSLGGGSSKALNDAAGRLFTANIPIIVAAGNEAANACSGSPSGAPGAFAVGASDRADRIASFSNFGQCVKIFGPGVAITSAWIGSRTATNTISGTSMASPHVAGVAALYLGTNPSLKTTAQVYKLLQSTASKNVITGSLRGSANLMAFNGGGK
ncbi:subtilisin-like serine protease [Entomortierella beljakovae]|nr:subtilisin-like serine protease [Entomortierella beljakovae]